MPTKKITRENAISNIKHNIIRRYNIMAISLTLTILFTLLIPTVVLFFVISGNPANDIGPIIMAISMGIVIISVIVFVFSFFSGLKYRNKKKNLFSNEEKQKYMHTYLGYLIVRYTMLFFGIFLIILGLHLKNRTGVISSYSGLSLTIVGLCSTTYVEIRKSMYKESKMPTVDDIIISNGIFFNLSLVERTILSIVLISIIVMVFNLIAGNLNIVFEIILLILTILLYFYNLYVCVKTYIKYAKNAKNND